MWTSSKQAERVCSTGPTCLKDTLTEKMGLYHWTPGRSIGLHRHKRVISKNF